MQHKGSIVALTVFGICLVALSLWITTGADVYAVGSVWEPDNPTGQLPDPTPWSARAIRSNSKTLTMAAFVAVPGLLCLVGAIVITVRSWRDHQEELARKEQSAGKIVGATAVAGVAAIMPWYAQARVQG